MPPERLERAWQDSGADTVPVLASPRAPEPLVEALGPGLSAWDVCLRLAHLPHLLFLDSAETHPTLGRYSFVTADPFEWHTARGTDAGDPLAALADRLRRVPAVPTVAGLPPFQGGAAGLFGYDLCHHIERLPRPRFD